MRKEITVAAERREGRGKNEARRLRAQGRIPAVVYGARSEAAAIAVDPQAITKILHSSTGHNTIFDLEVGGGAAPVMIVDWQNDPIKDQLLHVDFKRIDLNQRITVKVPVHPEGEPRGVKQQGGLLEIVTREIEIECLPDEIPDMFHLDVTGLMIGNNVRASEIPMTGSMRLVSNPDGVLAHVVALRASAETPAAAEAAPATPEPEVIKKGKKEAEGEAPAGEKKKK
jgi:large subunit ribosomal protein L25